MGSTEALTYFTESFTAGLRPQAVLSLVSLSPETAETLGTSASAVQQTAVGGLAAPLRTRVRMAQSPSDAAVLRGLSSGEVADSVCNFRTRGCPPAG